MKRFFILLITAFVLVSCNEYKPVYEANINGDADGKVAIVFPDGHFNISGTTALEFNYGNDTLTTFCVQKGLDLAEAEKIDDKNMQKTIAAARDYEDGIYVNADAGATYYLLVDLYFLEPISGTEIHTHKVLTNREQ